MANRKTLDEKIEAAKLEREQAEARIKQLMQQQKEQDRKDRTHRLCKRGGLVEKLLPDLVTLTDEQFETFVQKTLMSGFAMKIIRELTAQSSVPAEPKPTDTPQAANANINGKPADATRVAS